jgi:signal transduction histidine kinase
MLAVIFQFRRWAPRYVLFAGFGGLLILMSAVGVDALRMMRQAKANNSEIRGAFLFRNGALEEIRAGIYISGTLARDYLLANDPASAQAQRDQLRATERQTDAALDSYSRSLSPRESDTFRSLLAEIHTYWKVLDLLLEPDREVQRRGSPYFYNQLVLRRVTMLDLADRIDRWNAQDVGVSDARLAAMFDGFRFRLLLILGLTLPGGLALASVATAQLLGSQRQLKELSSRLVSAQEEERRSISRELHDEIGQSLTAVLMEASAAASESKELSAHLRSIKNLAETSLESVRNMALLLRPPMLDDLGLIPAVEWQAREISKRTGMKVRVTTSDVAENLSEDQRTCIYRVVQESLNNSARHAQARVVQVRLVGGDKTVQLIVRDDGAGFDAQSVRGLGLLGMEERVRRAGGDFHLVSQAGQGTELCVTLPLPGNSVNGAVR